MELKVGDQAPDFRMAASEGQSVSLGEARGKPFVLYFYPRADTPACTREALAFQAAMPEFTKRGVMIIGVSRDPMTVIDAFARKYRLTFPLAADETGAVAKAYGTWVEKMRYGRKYMGMERSTFLIDGSGRIAHIWRKVKVEGHLPEVTREAERL